MTSSVWSIGSNHDGSYSEFQGSEWRMDRRENDIAHYCPFQAQRCPQGLQVLSLCGCCWLDSPTWHTIQLQVLWHRTTLSMSDCLDRQKTWVVTFASVQGKVKVKRTIWRMCSEWKCLGIACIFLKLVLLASSWRPTSTSTQNDMVVKMDLLLYNNSICKAVAEWPQQNR